MKQKFFVANKAIILNEKNEVLLIQESPEDPVRSHPGKWDVVGGRMEFGEKPLEALAREVQEEIGMQVDVGRPIYVDDWRPQPIPDEQWHIVGIFYTCTPVSDTVTLSNEHMNYAWVALDDIDNYELIGEVKLAIHALKDLA